MPTNPIAWPNRQQIEREIEQRRAEAKKRADAMNAKVQAAANKERK